MAEKETADGLTKEQLAWIDEEDKKLDANAKKIESGEIDFADVEQWQDENWLAKTAIDKPEDIE